MVDSEPDTQQMIFLREAESLSTVAMARMAKMPVPPLAAQTAARPERPEYRTMRRFWTATD